MACHLPLLPLILLLSFNPRSDALAFKGAFKGAFFEGALDFGEGTGSRPWCGSRFDGTTTTSGETMAGPPGHFWLFKVVLLVIFGAVH